jgi:hypothetical protein
MNTATDSKPPTPTALASASLFGIVVQAGTDFETGKPRIIIETDGQQLRDIERNMIFKPCRIELLERCPVLPLPKTLRLTDAGPTTL